MTLVTSKTRVQITSMDESSSDLDDDNTNNAQQTQNEQKVQWVEVDPENISVINIPFSRIPLPNDLPLHNN